MDDMKTDKKDRKRLVVDVEIALHQHVRILAAQRNISMHTWLYRAILDRIAKENRKTDDEPAE